jgi:cohesin complex subunit SA-1/2
VCLINVHIAFGPAEKMAILLDDEVQFRCAGYVQAEIERYSETLVEPDAGEQDEDEDEDEDEEKENDSGDEGSDTGDKGKKTGKGKANAPKTKKRTVKEG